MAHQWHWKILPLGDGGSDGPLPPSEYYNLNHWKRLFYRIKYRPRRVADLVMIFFSIFLEWLGSTLLAPVTPWYVEKLAPDMNQGTAASILMASYAVGTFLASLLTGPLSDRLGRRPVFLAGMTIYTVAQFLVANAWDLTTFAVFRAIGGTAAGSRPVIIAYLIDSSRPVDMKLYGAFLGLSVVIGRSIGPIIGGALASVSLSFPFYFIGVIASVLLILMFLFLRESLIRDKDGNPIRPVGVSMKDPPRNKYLIPTVMCLSLASFCGQTIGITWQTVFGLIGVDYYGLTTSQNGSALGVQAVAPVVMNLIYLPITHFIPAAIVGAIGMLISMIIIVVPFVHNLAAVIVLGLCMQAGTSLYFAGQAYYNSVIAPPKKRGLVNSCVMASANVGGIVGPLVAGDLYDLGLFDPFYFSISLSATGFTACIGIFLGMRYQLNLYKSVQTASPITPKSLQTPPRPEGDIDITSDHETAASP
ncbi:Multidrug resistance protein, putative [Perkinsus marinus ATCC 50983]|uniref:Multidrug resistance protein, putative n=1 Tax=Perkinsus marinus (strain ATCC 50983 / TXsc) TaxID=423536 RepID=C5KX87_PERM5|nr:Multidrug resistance protein, putative [Perkinsus marinus ATCC 50983]EER10943.1 Multidrug resistance protein, putative [Perkinsus marinus ATCC 50983]|eukprot:XP_002779148.1 Multidrug resistance protein, putative [Perkinsus marinus ATCC 50983]